MYQIMSSMFDCVTMSGIATAVMQFHKSLFSLRAYPNVRASETRAYASYEHSQMLHYCICHNVSHHDMLCKATALKSNNKKKRRGRNKGDDAYFVLVLRVGEIRIVREECQLVIAVVVVDRHLDFGVVQILIVLCDKVPKNTQHESRP
jgi:hypothetical protein